MTSGIESLQRPSKRRKVAESCKLCRAKKTRCDGQRPVCSPCVAKGSTCEYNDATVPVSASTLSGFEERLRRLESQMLAKPAREQILPLVSDAPVTPLNPTPQTSEHGGWQRRSHPTTGCAVPEAEPPFADNPTTQFIQDLAQITDIHSVGRPLQASLWGMSDVWPVETDTSSMTIPKRAIADNLLDCYEQYVYPLFPILHMPTFRRAYKSLWEPEKQGQISTLAEEAIFHASLNIVFALGCINNSMVEPHLKLRTAEMFYHRARKILPTDALDLPSLGIVQYLLLTANYLSFTRYCNRCCNILAVATRVAQTLGLDMDVEGPSNNQCKREMSRRIWHLCLTFERVFSSLFGRRTIVQPDNSVPLPERIDDEYLLEDGIAAQPLGIPSELDALIVTINIFDVIEGAHKINYGFLTRCPRLPELTEVLQLNEKIDQIENSLPPHLRGNQSVKARTPRDRRLVLQAEAIMTRILHLRLVLLRPNVLGAARQSLMTPASEAPSLRTESTLQATLRTEVSTLCVRAALTAIGLLHANLRSASRLLSSNAVFVTLSAATVIVAASLVPELRVSLEDDTGPYGDAIKKAFQVLDEHRWQIEGAPRAKDQLGKFLETVNEEQKRRKAANRTLDNLARMGDGQSPFDVDNVASEFELSDPLWDFQWGDSAPLFGMNLDENGTMRYM